MPTMSERSRGLAELKRAAGCDKRRPPTDLSWLFSQVPESAVESHKEDSQDGGSLFQVLPAGTEGVSLLEQQTYRQWKSLMGQLKLSHPRRLRRHTIVLQPLTSPALPGYPLTEVAPVVLHHLQRFCSAFFAGMAIELAPPLDLAAIPNLTSRLHSKTNRQQYLVGDILKHLQRHRPSHAQCVMGVATIELYPSPEWNFVLGHASLTSGCGIFGFGRYFTSQFSGAAQPTADQQLGQLWVLARVVSHELCHTLGMKHCYYFRCAMNESASIEEAATQPLFLCPVCLRKLRKWLRFDVFQRYSQMKEVLSEMVEVSLSLTAAMPANNPNFQESGEITETVAGGFHIPHSFRFPEKREKQDSSLTQVKCLQEASKWLDSARESGTHIS